MAKYETIAQVGSLIEALIKDLVSNPEQVLLSGARMDAGVELTVLVASVDIDVVTGKSGRTMRALRTVLRAIEIQQGIHYSLSIRGVDRDRVCDGV